MCLFSTTSFFLYTQTSSSTLCVQLLTLCLFHLLTAWIPTAKHQSRLRGSSAGHPWLLGTKFQGPSALFDAVGTTFASWNSLLLTYLRNNVPVVLHTIWPMPLFLPITPKCQSFSSSEPGRLAFPFLSALSSLEMYTFTVSIIAPNGVTIKPYRELNECPGKHLIFLQCAIFPHLQSTCNAAWQPSYSNL